MKKTAENIRNYVVNQCSDYDERRIRERRKVARRVGKIFKSLSNFNWTCQEVTVLCLWHFFLIGKF